MDKKHQLIDYKILIDPEDIKNIAYNGDTEIGKLLEKNYQKKSKVLQKTFPVRSSSQNFGMFSVFYLAQADNDLLWHWFHYDDIFASGWTNEYGLSLGQAFCDDPKEDTTSKSYRQ